MKMYPYITILLIYITMWLVYTNAGNHLLCYNKIIIFSRYEILYRIRSIRRILEIRIENLQVYKYIWNIAGLEILAEY